MACYANVDQLPPSANLLDTTRHAERWSIGPEDSLWFCGGCGAALEDEEEGCEACGEGCLSDVDAADDTDDTEIETA